MQRNNPKMGYRGCKIFTNGAQRCTWHCNSYQIGYSRLPGDVHDIVIHTGLVILGTRLWCLIQWCTKGSWTILRLGPRIIRLALKIQWSFTSCVTWRDFTWHPVWRDMTYLHMTAHVTWRDVMWCDLPYISVYKSRNLSQNKVLHRQFVLYTGNTLREEIIPKASWIFKVRAHHDSAVVSDNAWIDEYSIAPLIYHLYTNQFLCYSWDIIL